MSKKGEWNGDMTEFKDEVDVDYKGLESNDVSVDLTSVTLDEKGSIDLDNGYNIRNHSPNTRHHIVFSVVPDDKRDHKIENKLEEKLETLFSDFQDQDGIYIDFGAASFFHVVVLDKSIDKERLFDIIVDRLERSEINGTQDRLSDEELSMF